MEGIIFTIPPILFYVNKLVGKNRKNSFYHLKIACTNLSSRSKKKQCKKGRQYIWRV